MEESEKIPTNTTPAVPAQTPATPAAPAAPVSVSPAPSETVASPAVETPAVPAAAPVQAADPESVSTSSEPEPVPNSDSKDASKLEDTSTEKKTEEPNPMAIHTSSKTRRMPSPVILISVLVFLVLAGAAVFAYLQLNKEAKPAKSANTNAATPPAAPQAAETKVKAADLDQLSTDIDTALSSTDDTKDFPDSDLSDTTLGL